jgi:hypothetical protein
MYHDARSSECQKCPHYFHVRLEVLVLWAPGTRLSLAHDGKCRADVHGTIIRILHLWDDGKKIKKASVILLPRVFPNHHHYTQFASLKKWIINRRALRTSGKDGFALSNNWRLAPSTSLLMHYFPTSVPRTGVRQSCCLINNTPFHRTVIRYKSWKCIQAHFVLKPIVLNNVSTRNRLQCYWISNFRQGNSSPTLYMNLVTNV